MRRVARFDRVMSSGDLRSSVDRVRRERNLINASFDEIRNLGDSLVFELEKAGSGRFKCANTYVVGSHSFAPISFSRWR
jgi:hypothetical protein